MTVAMARAERTHHSSGVWGREMNYTATILDPLPPTPQPELFSLEEEPGGARSGPRAREQRRIVQRIVDFAPLPTLVAATNGAER